jgi:hypothetical protein
MLFAGISALLAKTFAMYAVHVGVSLFLYDCVTRYGPVLLTIPHSCLLAQTGIPEIKVISFLDQTPTNWGGFLLNGVCVCSGYSRWLHHRTVFGFVL